MTVSSPLTEPDLKIRRATINDVSIIAEYNYNLAFETEDKKLDIDVLTRGVKSLIEDESKGVYYLCEIDGKVVGQIMYTFEWSDWRNKTFLWVQSVYVDKEYRQKGVFKSLYNYVKSFCDNDDSIGGIRLYVEKQNKNAQSTYKSLGMIECEYDMYEYEK